MRDGVFSWRIMVDFGQAVAISFKEFFVDDYFSDCYSYVAVSNKMYSVVLLCVSQIKMVAASDGLSCWALVMRCSKYTLLKMCNMGRLTEILVW
jgi:hypothetical protein